MIVFLKQTYPFKNICQIFITFICPGNVHFISVLIRITVFVFFAVLSD
jgi:hypothetical protein